MKFISSSGEQNLGACIAMIVLGTVSVMVRLGLRFFFHRQMPSASDWTVIASLAMMILYAAMIMQYIVAGPGDGSLDFTAILLNGAEGLVQAKAMLKNLYVSELSFVMSIGLVKLSILFFYHGLFGISQRFRLVNTITIAICAAWTTAFVLVYIFQCTPIHMFWDAYGASEYCLASGTTTLVLELTNLFGDVFILAMPLFMINRLKLRPIQKWTTMGIISLGGGVCIVSMIRLHYIWNPSNPQFVRVSEAMVLSTIQAGVAILCACLPTYGPIIQTCLGKRTGSSGNSNSKHYYNYNKSPGQTLITAANNNAEYSASNKYIRVQDDRLSGSHSNPGEGGNESYGMDSLNSDSIFVKKTVEVV